MKKLLLIFFLGLLSYWGFSQDVFTNEEVGRPGTTSDDTLAVKVTDTANVKIVNAYDVGTDVLKVSNQTPAEMKYTEPENLTGGFEDEAAGTYRYVFDLTNSGYEKAGFHYKIYAATADDQIVMTVWISNNSDADASADTDWFDVSTTVLGGANITVTNTTTESFKWFNSVTPVARAMVKLVVTYGGGAAADNAVDIFINRTN